MLRAAIDWDCINNALARMSEGEQGGHDGGHAGVENQRRVRSGFKRHHLVFQNFGVRMVESRINQVRYLAGFRLRASRHQIEGALGRFGARENVGGTAEDSRPCRSDRTTWVEASGKNLGMWSK